MFVHRKIYSDFGDNVIAMPLQDDDSDLEFELLPSPAVSSEANAEVVRWVKVRLFHSLLLAACLSGLDKSSSCWFSFWSRCRATVIRGIADQFCVKERMELLSLFWGYAFILLLFLHVNLDLELHVLRILLCGRHSINVCHGCRQTCNGLIYL